MHVKSWIPAHHLGLEAEVSSGECLDLRLQQEIDWRGFLFCKTPPQKSQFPLPLPSMGLKHISEYTNTNWNLSQVLQNILKEAHLWMTKSVVRVAIIFFSLFIQKRKV